MSGWRFALRAEPQLRVDLRGVTPDVLAPLAAAQIEGVPVGYGNTRVPLAEFFSVVSQEEDSLVFEGDLSRFDRVGWQMAGGRMRVAGSVGHYAGGCMRAGELVVEGDAGLLAACEMAGGTLTVKGSVGDFAASTLPGSMDGMRGGTVVVMGDAGERFGDRMRRGSAVVHGNAGDFLASRLVAGTIAIGGRAGAHAGFLMRRGSLVFADATVTHEIPPTFVAAHGDVQVFWQLLARELARHGGPFAGLAARQVERHLGDLSVDGKGEIIRVR